ncbi:MAG: hypothetical protein HC784_05570 [Hydrococcus sp. CSU_1_8]|nr:hypothetical protein [Hydrococcus sp. CSU_1_8]
MPFIALVFSRDGQRIATASSDGTARLWDLEGNLRTEFKGQEDSIYGIDFSFLRSQRYLLKKPPHKWLLFLEMAQSEFGKSKKN